MHRSDLAECQVEEQVCGAHTTELAQEKTLFLAICVRVLSIPTMPESRDPLPEPHLMYRKNAHTEVDGRHTYTPKITQRQQILIKAQQLVLDVKSLGLLAFYGRCRNAR